MTFAGCTHLDADGTALRRNLPNGCDRLAQRVPLPEVKEGDDMRLLTAKHRARIVEANRRLDSSRLCQERVRKEYARGAR